MGMTAASAAPDPPHASKPPQPNWYYSVDEYMCIDCAREGKRRAMLYLPAGIIGGSVGIGLLLYLKKLAKRWKASKMHVVENFDYYLGSRRKALEVSSFSLPTLRTGAARRTTAQEEVEEAALVDPQGA